MTGEYEILKKRFVELASKAYNGNYYTFTDILGLAEQSAFTEILPQIKGIKYTAFGGCDGAERVMIRFGNPDEIGYDVDFPIACIKAEPLSQKFADKLSHRDFLGAILNLGIERDTLGDIVITDNVGYIFCKEDIAGFITDGLTRVKRTDIKCELCNKIPTERLYKTEQKQIQISSERVDSVVAKAFNLSRDDAQSLFKKGLIFVNGKECVSVSHTPRANDKISVRGHGRLIYKGYKTLSKKGKLNAIVEIYV